MMKQVLLKDKQFKVLIPSEEVQQAVERIADRMNSELAGKMPLFICVLNGAFHFAADLLKRLDMDCEITFVKLASYSGISSSGEVKTLIGLDKEVNGRVVVILEDIVDSGLTLECLIAQLEQFNPKEIKVATLLFKPDAYTKEIELDYVAMEVENRFIVGYGLDYDGLGRNLRDIYVLAEEHVPIIK